MRPEEGPKCPIRNGLNQARDLLFPPLVNARHGNQLRKPSVAWSEQPPNEVKTPDHHSLAEVETVSVLPLRAAVEVQ